MAPRNFVAAEFPSWSKDWFRAAPYKVAHGGRGSAKSWTFVRAALILGMNRKLFILCTREIQKSIKESAHKLIGDMIDAMGLGSFYTVLETEIRGINGTRIVFAGLKNQFRAIKSMEAIDLCIVFEATFISDPAWETLLPTVRRDPPHGPFGEGSEVWVEFNPELASDATYKRWVLNPPPGTVVREVNYVDNPWFPEILRRQMVDMKERDPDAYRTVWMGKVRRALSGAIYAKELAKAIEDGRIGANYRYDRSIPVDVTFDLGRADTMALWFVQQIGTAHVVLEYYGNSGYDFAHYLEEIEHRPYRIGRLILPHDARHKVAAAKYSIEQQARQQFPGPGRIKIVPATKPVVRISAVRSMFDRLYFNEPMTSEGVLCLQHYQYGVHPEDPKKVTPEPLHNWASHAADSLGHYALSLRRDVKQFDEDDRPVDPFSIHHPSSVASPTSWMA